MTATPIVVGTLAVATVALGWAIALLI